MENDKNSASQRDNILDSKTHLSDKNIKAEINDAVFKRLDYEKNARNWYGIITFIISFIFILSLLCFIFRDAEHKWADIPYLITLSVFPLSMMIIILKYYFRADWKNKQDFGTDAKIPNLEIIKNLSDTLKEVLKK